MPHRRANASERFPRKIANLRGKSEQTANTGRHKRNSRAAATPGPASSATLARVVHGPPVMENPVLDPLAADLVSYYLDQVHALRRALRRAEARLERVAGLLDEALDATDPDVLRGRTEYIAGYVRAALRAR